MEIQTDQWNLQMVRLVNAYLYSHHQDEGEGLPKMPDQPPDDVGPSIAIEVADMFCMFIPPFYL